MATPAADHTIPHQNLVEEVIDQRIVVDKAADDAAYAAQGTAVIASPTADAASLKTAVDAIRAALTASGVTN